MTSDAGPPVETRTLDVPPATIGLDDYRPPDFLIDTVNLHVELGEEVIRIRSRLAVRRHRASHPTAPLRLQGERFSLTQLALDGTRLEPDAYALEAGDLVVPCVPDRFTLEVASHVHSHDASGPLGLTRSGDVFFTHCEAEGFRRLTYFSDRPDVMARYTTTLVADRARYPVLLSNGNLIARGRLKNGQHWARWQDPYPKPCYVFAIVAGNLLAHRDRHRTRSGREVDLAVWVRPGDEDRCSFAMRALKEAMRWEETVYGLEYDLQSLNLVALSDFGMEAMENKGLPIFNARFVLTSPATTTDADYRAVETTIAHEYFHNWTGNRIAIRDWFQLALKEGLTVFRTREFMADRGSQAARRVDEVREFRAAASAAPPQPLRPPGCAAIANLFVPAVYAKGAEIVRMVAQAIGADAFRRGIALFRRRYDGCAVIIEDFLDALAEASGTDLSHILRWYEQGGTPELTVNESYDPDARTHTVTIDQAMPGEEEVRPLVIPLTLALLDPSGADLPIRLEGEVEGRPGTRTLLITERRQHFRFLEVPCRPVVSLLRGFSAPVLLRGQTPESLRFLAVRDSDPYARWSACQHLATHVLLDLVRAFREGERLVVAEPLLSSFAENLAASLIDPAYAAEVLSLPSETALGEALSVVDVEAIHAARSFARADVARRFRTELLTIYAALEKPQDSSGADPAGRRALKHVCLDILGAVPDPEITALARRQFHLGEITDTVAALRILIDLEGPEGEAACGFFQTWNHEPALLDAWFDAQARASHQLTAEVVAALARHPAFDLRRTSRVNSLVLTFAADNPFHFHAANGRGYDYLADRIFELDSVNAPVASRLVLTLAGWRRYDSVRQSKMLPILARIAATASLSRGVRAVAAESLA